MSPPRVSRAYLDAPARRTRAGFEDHETKLAAVQPGGRRQHGSGNGKGAGVKGDATGDMLLISGKTTGKASIALRRDWLEEITQQAGNAHRIPALGVGFDGPPRFDWLALPHDVVTTMTHVVAAVLAGDHQKALDHAELLRRQS